MRNTHSPDEPYFPVYRSRIMVYVNKGNYKNAIANTEQMYKEAKEQYGKTNGM